MMKAGCSIFNNNRHAANVPSLSSGPVSDSSRHISGDMPGCGSNSIESNSRGSINEIR